MNRRKRKSTPVVFGGKVSDEVLLMQRQIEEPEEEQGFGWLINRRATTNDIQPTGRRSRGSSGAYAPLNHEHPTALIPTSSPQEPVENEIRFDGGGFLRRWNGTSWELIPPLPSNTTPQPTGVSQVGTSVDYSRADHSHPTAILAQGNSQTPVSNEIRYSTNNELVRWDGSNWVAFKIDASNILNPPPSTITVRKNSGSNVGTRPRLNFIEGNNITLTISDDSTDDEIDITISATGGGGGGTPYNNTPQPTGIASAGTSTDYSRGDHSHATALIAQSNAQTPVERELRYTSSDALVMRVGNNWVPVKVEWGDVLNQPTIPSPSNTTPQPTGVAGAGSSSEYSRADHSHPTALLAESNNQTPVSNELRFKTTNELVRWDGSNWVPIKVDATNVLNLPPSTITVRKNSGVVVGTRPRLNFIEGNNITITVADDATDNEVDITINSTAGTINPSNANPTPTGFASAGTSTEYSRGDHSHPTALISIFEEQSPVQNELRFYPDDLVLAVRVGNNWQPVQIHWNNILNPPPLPQPASGDLYPKPTGEWKLGMFAHYYSRADHSHPTAVLPIDHEQTPTTNEIRFTTDNKLVRYTGQNWVPLSVELGGSPVQKATSYSQQGVSDGEIWYRTNDKAVFFKIDGQRVYPAAALLTVSESATNTGAGNRILLLNSTADNLLRVGGTVNQTVFAYPKLPIIVGDMTTDANWNTGAGSNPTGALWVNVLQGNLPFIYYNSFTPERFLVGRIKYQSGSTGTGAYASSEPDGVIEMGEGGNLLVKGSGLTYVYGYSHTFDFVSDGFIRIVSAGSVVDKVFSGSTAANVVDIFSNNILTYLYDKYVELGDASDTVFIMFPMGFLRINNDIQAANFRMRVEMPYIRVSGSNAESWQAGLIFVDVSGSSVRKAYLKIAPMSSSTITSCGSGLMNWSALTNNMRFEINYWEYYENGTYMNSTSTVPTGRYHVLFLFRRTRGTENTPRSTTRHRYISVMTTLPINRMWFE